MTAVILLSVLSVAFATGTVLKLCSLPPEMGRCRGYFPRYYYDQEYAYCLEFIYGGCGGNDNNFENEGDCLDTCGTADEFCSLPPEAGRCRGFFPKYHYDQEYEECHEFVYGGCGGNDNKFDTLEDCEDTCVN